MDKVSKNIMAEMAGGVSRLQESNRFLEGGSAEGRVKATATRVKNKSAAPIQITAEQILREAQDMREVDPKPPQQKITDEDELQMYKMRKRKEFEDHIRHSRTTLTHYTKYAAWEESQGEFRRARSIWERVLEVDYRTPSLWLKYAEMEMRHKHINHARNIWDRAVTLLPRVEQLWFKYSYMEEMLGNVPGARQVFERWMEWEPNDNAWTSYVRLEMRYDEVDRARAIYERYVVCHNTTTAWLKYAKFEERRKNVTRARSVMERALEYLEQTEFAQDETLFINFAQFEQRAKEFERARVIFKYALDLIPKQQAADLYRTYTNFEKQHGSREGVEEVIISKRRFQYEEELKKNQANYDVWFDYIRLEEAHGDVEAVREVYERAIANVPPPVKARWRRYIYLWINYALFEELKTGDVEKTRAVYKECLGIIPHKRFSFSKVWTMAAHFEVRQRDLAAARKILGNAIGRAPKAKVFLAYIELEYSLSNIDRTRALYQRWLEESPENCEAWTQYAQMEQSLEETSRARALFELAVDQPLLDMPEVIWKQYIDFEIQNAEHDLVRQLYDRLLSKTRHVKVWISYAQFEASIEDYERAREVFAKATKLLKVDDAVKEERVMLLESWRQFEAEFGDETTQKTVLDKMPRRVKRKRQLEEDDEEGWEEYFDYIFPDEEAMTSANKLLEIAQKWKMRKLTAPANDDEDNNNAAADDDDKDDDKAAADNHDDDTAQ